MNPRGEVATTTAFCATGMTASIMKTILGRQQAAPASSAAICKTTIKEITPVLNGGTQVARCGNFFC
jgi:hypothetical protein